MRTIFTLCSTALVLPMSNLALASDHHVISADKRTTTPQNVLAKDPSGAKEEKPAPNLSQSKPEIVSVTATRDARVISPSSVSLDAVQPESRVSHYYISHVAPPVIPPFLVGF